MIKKQFKFKKGIEDWKTWIKVTDFIFNYFVRKRKSNFKSAKLKTDYIIDVSIYPKKEQQPKEKQ